MAPLKKIAVIGAGIIGMSSAYRLQTELPFVEVTVISDKFSPELTSDGAAGLWEPYSLEIIDPVKGLGWSMDTYDHLLKLAQSPDSFNSGVTFITYVELFQEPPTELPEFTPHVLDFKLLDREELQRYPNATHGFSFSTVTCEPRIHLPWISKRFTKAGGKFKTQYVTDMSKVCDAYDLVVNCTGLGASNLVNDDKMVPIRGQVIKVKSKQPINRVSMLKKKEFRPYVIPGRDMVTLGGTYNIGDASTAIRPEIKEKILSECIKLEPALKDCEILFDWCGSRPLRSSGTRLEVDNTIHHSTKVIHNYGHAGVGISLHWGCAGEVVSLAKTILNIQLRSKL